MNGRWTIICLGLFVALLSSKASACSCAWHGDFCEAIKAFYPEAHSVFTLRVVDKYDYEKGDLHFIPMIDIEVIQHLAGPEITFDTITLIGQDGLNCSASLFHIEIGDTMLVSIPNLADTLRFYDQRSPTHHINELPNCGIHHLTKEGPFLIQRNYDNISDTLLYADFLSDFENCTSLPLIATSLRDESLIRFNIFPNPHSGTFHIKSQGSTGGFRYRIFDVSGQLVSEGKLTNSGDAQISLNDPKPGIYFVSIDVLSKSSIHRMVIH